VRKSKKISTLLWKYSFLIIKNIEELKLKIKDNLDSILEELLSKLPDKNHFKDSFTLSKGFEDNLVVFNDEKVINLN